MTLSRLETYHALLAFGLLSFLLAALSIVDLFVPRPYDGVVLEADAPGTLIVREVVPGSGADRAGIRHGDEIVGIDRQLLRSPAHGATLLGRREIGDVVPYLVDDGAARRVVDVELGPRRLGDPAYVYAGLLGLAFFGVGLFVLGRARRRRASRVFFVLCTLFMLFLVCRLRPASYSWVDTFVLSTGTVALLFLPATFLHFFLIFPRPLVGLFERPEPGSAGRSGRLAGRLALAAIYLVPPVVLLGSIGRHRSSGEPLALISGAPAANWWVLAAYILLGLAVLATNARTVDDPRERRGAALVFFGSLFGLVPFLVLAVAFPSLLHTEAFLFYGVIPLVLVPVTFAYAIVRFQLLDIRVLLQKSLLYTLTTAVVTAVYALGIASFNGLFRDTTLASSPYFPLVFALAIVLLFEPLRQRIQGPVDRFFHAERFRLQQALVDLGDAFAAHHDLGTVVRDLVAELPRHLGLHFAALYLARDGRLERVAGPPVLPIALPDLPGLAHALKESAGIARVDRLLEQGVEEETEALLAELAATGVEGIAALTSPRRRVGLVLLSGKTAQVAFEPEELELLRGLLHQASIALETNLLLEERTRQAELERELEIAASIQRSLLPAAVELAAGWQVAVHCRPARHVGGDFLVRLPGPHQEEGIGALAYGDVSGKSVSGALVMMAAYEILSSLAMTSRRPDELLELANRRLYRLGEQRGFVALGYLAPRPRRPGQTTASLTYLLAGQPPPLHVKADGTVTELALPRHRLPLGAMLQNGYEPLELQVEEGDLVLGTSDGVVESIAPDGEFFGTERLIEVLAGIPPELRGDPGEAVRRVLAAVDRFTGDDEPYDDLTLVALACRSAPAGPPEEP